MLPSEVKQQKKRYRVKDGKVFGAEDQFKPGEIVELTDAEYLGMQDKVEPDDGKYIIGADNEEPTPIVKKGKKSE